MQEIGSRANVTLLDSIDIELIKSAHNTQISIEQHLSNMYKRSYKQALEDIGASNKAINSRAVKEVLSYPWSDRNFSERIWGNKASTMNVLKEAISKGIIQGQSIQKMAKNIMDKENVSKYNAERLVRTETNFHMTKGHIDGYRESGVVKTVEICVHWDERTCPDCESMDREVIPLNEVSYGSNVPPFHPFCRCTVVPVIKDDNKKTSVENSNKTDYNKTYITINKSGKQFGKKIGKHAIDYGLDPSNPNDRSKMNDIIDNIVKNSSEQRIGDWRGQNEEVLFFIKENDVVVSKQDGEFVTILKGGIENARVKNARKR
ncbi:minor capsid protein [Terrisporobacter glycolicus]|nr:minor capsid protein [Terrisporobacter glycolicus]